MINLVIRLIVLTAMVLQVNISTADQTLVDSVKNGCKKELNSFCKNVTPGEGRVLACLYAFNDKLTGQCEFALYDAAAQLQHAVEKLTYVAKECEEDLDKHCTGVAIGEGRLLACLAKNDKNVSKRCKNALKEVDLK